MDTYLDGNAAAGPLADLFRFDVTAAVAGCASCGDTAVLARSRVFGGGPGLIMRCATCDSVLVRLVASENRAWLDLTGVACLQIERGGSG
jgi:hypothetical protein